MIKIIERYSRKYLQPIIPDGSILFATYDKRITVRSSIVGTEKDAGLTNLYIQQCDKIFVIKNYDKNQGEDGELLFLYKEKSYFTLTKNLFVSHNFVIFPPLSNKEKKYEKSLSVTENWLTKTRNEHGRLYSLCGAPAIKKCNLGSYSEYCEINSKKYENSLKNKPLLLDSEELSEANFWEDFFTDIFRGHPIVIGKSFRLRAGTQTYIFEFYLNGNLCWWEFDGFLYDYNGVGPSKRSRKKTYFETVWDKSNKFLWVKF